MVKLAGVLTVPRVPEPDADPPPPPQALHNADITTKMILRFVFISAPSILLRTFIIIVIVKIS
jgi:hypothetical protein